MASSRATGVGRSVGWFDDEQRAPDDDASAATDVD
jgi:hypothetical protein